MSIVVNLTKAKTIAHERRKLKRAEEFKPHDDIIMKQIPGEDATKAETERAKIRTKYATIQTDIDNAKTVDALKTVYDNASLGD
ncbi:hypothetical protein [Phenylobacterium sp.]|uniref:hypothetical protein n=1 Tax=Phenylobacterium sp. TaxID=1871053 RepID=UPI0025F86567|nr:hypothetical protein [Phenylobacterium sp.]